MIKDLTDDHDDLEVIDILAVTEITESRMMAANGDATVSSPICYSPFRRPKSNISHSPTDDQGAV